MSELVNLFPIPVLHKRQLIGADHVRDMARRVAEQATHANHADDGLQHSHRAEPSALLPDTVSHLLIDAITELGSYLFGQQLDWRIKELWANVMAPGGAQGMHMHANSFVSGVLYLTDSHPSANLVMHRPTGGLEFAFSNHNPQSTLCIYNAPRQQLGPIQAGDVILFPSYLLHSVPRNEGERRVSLAFNAIPHALETWGYRVLFDHEAVVDPAGS